MSAFLLCKAHIDTIVNGAIQLKVIRPDQAEWLGQLLWDENYRSVNHRYSEDNDPPEYKHEVYDAPFHPVAIVIALDCYDYQSCECPDWEKTEARQWSQRIREAAEKAAIWCRGYYRAQVEKATPWEVTDMSQVPVLEGTMS